MSRGAYTSIRIGADTREAQRKVASLTQEFRNSATSIKSSFADRLSAGLGRLHPELGRLGSVLGRAGPVGLGLAAVATTTVAVVAAFSKWSVGIDRIAKQSARLGVTETALQGIRIAADRSGVSTQQVEQALTKLQKRSVMAAEGNKELARGFEAAGLELEQFQRLSPVEKFEALTNAFRENVPENERVRRAMQLLGDQAGFAMTNMLATGDSIVDATRKAIDFGLALDSKTSKQVQNFRDNLADAGDAMRGAANRILVALAPAMEQLSKLVAWTAKAVNTLLKPFSDLVSWLISWEREQVTLTDALRQQGEQFKSRTKPDLEAEARLRREVAQAAEAQRKAIEPFNADRMVSQFIEANRVLGSDKYGREIEESFRVASTIRQRQAQIRTLQEMSPAEVMRLALEEGVSTDEIRRRNDALQVQLGQDLATLATRQIELAQLATAAVEAATSSGGQSRQGRGSSGRGGQGGSGLVEGGVQVAHGYGELADARSRYHAMREGHMGGQLAEKREEALSGEEDTNTRLRKIMADRESIIGGSVERVTQSISGMYTSMIQSAVAGEASLGAIMASMLGGFFQQIGAFLIQAGTAALAAGLLGDLFPFLRPVAGSAAVGGGAAVAAIAVGTGLVAAGAAMSSAAQGGATQSRGGATRSPSSARASSGPNVPSIGPDFGASRREDEPRQVIINFNGPTNSRRVRRELRELLA